MIATHLTLMFWLLMVQILLEMHLLVYLRQIRWLCWAHMRRGVDKKLCLINDNNERREVISDIEKLQICNSSHSFQLALELFLKRHEKHKGLIEYFKSEWLTAYSGWYEGYSQYTPSTNNALEATNKVI